MGVDIKAERLLSLGMSIVVSIREKRDRVGFWSTTNEVVAGYEGRISVVLFGSAGVRDLMFDTRSQLVSHALKGFRNRIGSRS